MKIAWKPLAFLNIILMMHIQVGLSQLSLVQTMKHDTVPIGNCVLQRKAEKGKENSLWFCESKIKAKKQAFILTRTLCCCFTSLQRVGGRLYLTMSAGNVVLNDSIWLTPLTNVLNVQQVPVGNTVVINIQTFRLYSMP